MPDLNEAKTIELSDLPSRVGYSTRLLVKLRTKQFSQCAIVVHSITAIIRPQRLIKSPGHPKYEQKTAPCRPFKCSIKLSSI